MNLIHCVENSDSSDRSEGFDTSSKSSNNKVTLMTDAIIQLEGVPHWYQTLPPSNSTTDTDSNLLSDIDHTMINLVFWVVKTNLASSSLSSSISDDGV